VSPEATETCNFVDDDCDKKIDEGFPASSWYEDLDGDGFGDPATSVSLCAPPDGFVELSGDCDLVDAATYPGAPEACDDVDHDCDGGPPPLAFEPAKEVETTLHTTSGVAADLDGDGDVDVAWTDQTDVAWSINLGPGTFVTSVLVDDTFFGPRGLCLGDLDGDGDGDLVWTTSSVDDLVAWAENRGGTFGPAQVVGDQVDGPVVPAIEDLDGDGDLDVVTGAADGAGVVWFSNLGDGSFEPLALPVDDTLDAPSALVALDGDADGDADVVAASAGGDDLVWLENLGTGTFAAPVTVAVATGGVTSLLTSDADGDGDLDLVATEGDDAAVVWLENLGGGAFGASAVLADFGTGPTTVAAAASDLDGDGDDDVLALSGVADRVVWVEQLGGGAFAPVRGVAERLYAVWVAGADIDGDEATDVIVGSSAAAPARIDWYESASCE
jgi:hypothetical protein